MTITAKNVSTVRRLSRLLANSAEYVRGVSRSSLIWNTIQLLPADERSSTRLHGLLSYINHIPLIFRNRCQLLPGLEVVKVTGRHRFTGFDLNWNDFFAIHIRNRQEKMTERGYKRQVQMIEKRLGNCYNEHSKVWVETYWSVIENIAIRSLSFCIAWMCLLTIMLVNVLCARLSFVVKSWAVFAQIGALRLTLL